MKLRVIIDGRFSVYTTPKAIKSGIGDKMYLNLAVQSAYDSMKRLKVLGVVETHWGYVVQIGEV